MPRFSIDNQVIEVRQGATILDAARQAGIEIPTLCYLPGRPAQTSCYLCLVKVEGSARFLPACATGAADGMVVESETEEVRDARRTALELLLSDHLGDCIGPCQGVCPAHMDIPEMIRHIAAGRMRQALITVKERIALPAVLGRICPELCEKPCRRGSKDDPISICLLKRYVADADLTSGDPYLPPCRPPSGKRVAIIGSGPAGLAAAYYLLQDGHACTLLDDHDQPGGMLRYGVSPDVLPHDVLDAEIDTIARMGAEFRCGIRVGADISLSDLRHDFDAALIAVGDVKKDDASPLGLEIGSQGVKVNKRTMMADLPGVFAAGSAIIPSRHAIRAVADGRAAAGAISRFLAGGPVAREEKEFSCHIGRLDATEVEPFLTLASSEGRLSPGGGGQSGFTEEEARREAQRCLHCDCRASDTCRLRRYAIEYDAHPTRFKAERRPFAQDRSNLAVIYEPGKCIACGICVQIASEASEQLGLTFVGRGFSVRTAVPFNKSLSEGLTRVARACANACPTGALVAKDDRET